VRNLAQSLHHLAIGFYFARTYDDAVQAAEHSIRSFPEYLPSYR
jgi:hypothetical protein